MKCIIKSTPALQDDRQHVLLQAEGEGLRQVSSFLNLHFGRNVFYKIFTLEC
jgi:hypothetical protein